MQICLVMTEAFWSENWQTLTWASRRASYHYFYGWCFCRLYLTRWVSAPASYGDA